MKIENEYVEIKIGNKTYTKQNMILNTYLNKIFNIQINNNYNDLGINYCYLKLDTPLENVDYDSELNGREDFDVLILTEYKPTIVTNNNYIKITYKFGNSRLSYKNSNGNYEQIYNLDILAGRKITGIGFGSNYECMAFLDTNYMNIIINQGEKIMITRVDNIMSDGIAQGIEYPLHLINNIANKELSYVWIDGVGYPETTRGKLYSVGFGNKIGYMEEEYLINDVETNRDNNSITFNMSRTKKIGHYPSENLFLGFYPTMDNSKYLIFKYKLYRRYFNDLTEEYVVTELDKYYTMNKPNEIFGNLEVKLKIERS